MDYYGPLKRLWDELGNFEQLPTCKCGKCTCNLGPILEKKQEEEKVHLFLKGLDENMHNEIQHIGSKPVTKHEQGILNSHSRGASEDNCLRQGRTRRNHGPRHTNPT